MEKPKCKSCSTTLEGIFCHHCGQKVMPRITFKELASQTFNNLTNIDKGFWQSTWFSLSAPGVYVRE